MTDPDPDGIQMLTKLGYIDGKWQTIYGIHTDPMGYGWLAFASVKATSRPVDSLNLMTDTSNLPGQNNDAEPFMSFPVIH